MIDYSSIIIWREFEFHLALAAAIPPAKSDAFLVRGASKPNVLYPHFDCVKFTQFRTGGEVPTTHANVHSAPRTYGCYVWISAR